MQLLFLNGDKEKFNVVTKIWAESCKPNLKKLSVIF